MKGALFGFYGLSILVMHGILFLLEWAGRFPYFATPLYPLVCLGALLTGTLGFFERDRRKLPALTAMLTGGGLLIHWVVMLVMRLSA